MSNCSHQTFPGAHVAADVTTAHFPAGGLQRHGGHGWVLVGNSAPVFGGLKEHSIVNRRKFRSQPADNMDRLKSRGGKSQRGEEKKREDQRKESEERGCRCAKNRQVAIHGGRKVRSGRSKNRLAKAAGAEPSGQMRHERLHAVGARITF